MRVHDLLDTPADVTDPDEPVVLTECDGRIELEGVRFGFGRGAEVQLRRNGGVHQHRFVGQRGALEMARGAGGIASGREIAGRAGGEVTSTIRRGIIDSSYVIGEPELLIYGMLAALLAAGTWLLLASRMGWPVSTTHSIVGAIVGFAVVTLGVDAVEWARVGAIVASWVVSPLTAGVIAFLIFSSIQRLILGQPDPLVRARMYAPWYIFVTVTLISLVTMFKGLSHVGFALTTAECYGVALCFDIGRSHV